MKRERRVYFMKPIGMDGPIKIGCSCDPDERLVALSTWSPFPLEIVASAPGTYQDEAFLHSCFADTHSHREWFHASSILAVTISRIAATGTIDGLRDMLKPVGKIRGSGTRNEPDYRKGYRSYNARLWWTEKKRRNAGIRAARAPDDVHAIISRWAGTPYRNVPGVRPTDAEFARLDQAFSDPDAHFIVPHWVLEREAKAAAATEEKVAA